MRATKGKGTLPGGQRKHEYAVHDDTLVRKKKKERERETNGWWPFWKKCDTLFISCSSYHPLWSLKFHTFAPAETCSCLTVPIRETKLYKLMGVKLTSFKWLCRCITNVYNVLKGWCLIIIWTPHAQLFKIILIEWTISQSRKLGDLVITWCSYVLK